MGRTSAGFTAAKLARERGESRYFTGLPCKRGHIAARQVSNKTCVECLKERAAANPEWSRRYDRKRQQTLFRRAQKAASERKCRKADHRQATRAAERRARQAAQMQRTPKWVDLNEIRKFYRRARELTKQTGSEWHVDHEIPLRGKIVSGLHVAENLRVIPAIPNLSKGSSFMA